MTLTANIGFTIGAKRFKQASDDEEEVKQNDSLPSLTTTSHAPHSLIEIEQRLCTDLLKIDYSPCGVQYVYNPLDYASETHSDFVLKYGNGLKKILFLGMNPGPFGMAQNGVSIVYVIHNTLRYQNSNIMVLKLCSTLRHVRMSTTCNVGTHPLVRNPQIFHLFTNECVAHYNYIQLTLHNPILISVPPAGTVW